MCWTVEQKGRMSQCLFSAFACHPSQQCLQKTTLVRRCSSATIGVITRRIVPAEASYKDNWTRPHLGCQDALRVASDHVLRRLARECQPGQRHSIQLYGLVISVEFDEFVWKLDTPRSDASFRCSFCDDNLKSLLRTFITTTYGCVWNPLYPKIPNAMRNIIYCIKIYQRITVG